MDKILHDPKDPTLWEVWYIPYYGSCRILSINRRVYILGFRIRVQGLGNESRAFLPVKVETQNLNADSLYPALTPDRPLNSTSLSLTLRLKMAQKPLYNIVFRPQKP